MKTYAVARANRTARAFVVKTENIPDQHHRRWEILRTDIPLYSAACLYRDKVNGENWITV